MTPSPSELYALSTPGPACPGGSQATNQRAGAAWCSGTPPEGGAAGRLAEPDLLRPVVGVALDEGLLNRLRWRCRRGMLENDLFVERLFARLAAQGVTAPQQQGLEALMAQSDNDLLDLFLARRSPCGALDTPAVHELLRLARP